MLARLIGYGLAASLAVAVTTSAFAKPPDLPLRGHVVCTESGPGPADEGQSEDSAVVDATNPCVCQACVAWVQMLWQNLGLRQPVDGGFTCPFLKAQAQATPDEENESADGPTVLENLRKLEKAQRLCVRARHYEREGRTEQAARCYEEAVRLCPGSRHAQMAAEQLQRLRQTDRATVRQPGETRPQGEEAETPAGTPEE